VSGRQSQLPYAQSFARGFQSTRQRADSLQAKTDIVKGQRCKKVTRKTNGVAKE
jgi:hypothetical protein